MTQVPENAESRSLRQWVLGLAIAIFCCAIFFHFVGRFLAETQEKIAVTQFKLEYLQARLDRLETTAAARLTTPTPAVAAPAPVTPPPVLSLPALIAPPAAPAPEVQAEKTPTPVKPEKPEADKKQTDKIIIMPSAELLLNTRTDTPDAVVPAKEGKTDIKTDKAKPKTKTNDE